ncbi:MAG: TIGR02757 family protein [Prevotella sp.]|nr:TIGR02757 family protein [Prevotella sp.]
MIHKNTVLLLQKYAAQYENEEFLYGDPSWFMHQVTAPKDQETVAFIASCLSYGSRKQFMPRIQWLMTQAGDSMHDWVLSGRYQEVLPADSDKCFYRLYTVAQMNTLMSILQLMLDEYGSIGEFVRRHAENAIGAIKALCLFFSSHGPCAPIPKDASSACKRLCMFIRWMVRDNSPVDLGLWTWFVDKKTLIMPLDTHVMQQACRLGLLTSKTTSMSTAMKLTDMLRVVFPDDPLKGDFALFGYGVNHT